MTEICLLVETKTKIRKMKKSAKRGLIILKEICNVVIGQEVTAGAKD